MSHLENIPFCRRAVSKVKSWFNPQTVDGSKIRSLVMGTLVTVIIGEMSAYRIIQQDIEAGELHAFTIDFIIIGISLLEILVGPFISWLGYNNRRLVILAWNIALVVVSLIWLAIPDVAQREESEYCHANTIRSSTTSSQAVVRLSLLILSCIVFCLTRVAAWSHGISYIEEHAAAETSLHFGILVTFRVVASTVFQRIIPRGQSINMQVFAMVGGTVGNIVQVFLFMPKNLTHSEDNPDTPAVNRGFVASAARVFRNTVAMSQMVGTGLLAAAMWGFSYHDAEIVKVKYHLDIVNGEDFGANLTLILRYLVVMMSVLYVGVKFSAPILPEFCRLQGIRQATVMGILGFIFYVLLTTVSTCEKGHVAGLGKNHYISPECNNVCACSPRWREFSPVCVVDQITTYLSPCHAGCSSSESLDNIRVFTNCTCAPGYGRAAVGACSLDSCLQAYEVHNTLFIVVVMTTVLAFQAQGMVLLRAVELRDRSLALGFTGSVVSSIAFGCGHLIYLGISAATCRWFESGRCHLYSQTFPIYISSASAAMAILSVVISVATWVAMKRVERRQQKNVNGSAEERILMDG